jgi:succinoglycan biosynthesis transport protein ExoP
MEKDLEMKDIRSFIRRRKKAFLISFFIVVIGGLSLAILLPPIYVSEATIRLENQQIPEDYVKPTITDFAEERIQKISQQVLSRPKLLEIIEKYNLFKDAKDRRTPTELVSAMRNKIGIESIVAETSNKKNRRADSVTVAFNVSFEGKDPATVQKVTEKLSNLYLEEDIKNREQMVAGATTFLENELTRINDEISRQEKKISEYKRAHLRELPSDINYNLQAISQLERSIDQSDMRLRILQEKKLLLESQLANVEPLTPVIIEGKDVAVNPRERLKELRLELASMQSVYSDKHPDIKKLRREIQKLESEVQNSDATVEKIKRLNQLEIQLASARAEFGPEHPDVKAINSEIKILRNQVNNLTSKSVQAKIAEEKPDNPAYINLKAQVETIEMEIGALQEEKKSLMDEINTYQKRIESTPHVEKELNALTRDLENFKGKYVEMSNKLMNAKVVQEMEGKQKGERFSITSPAYFPQKPTKPNRFAILLLSVLIAIGLSSVLVVAWESIDDSVKTSDQLRVLTGVPVLSSVSYIVTDQERRFRRLKKLGWGVAVVCCIGIAAYCVDRYLIELEALWSFVLDRLKMIT